MDKAGASDFHTLKGYQLLSGGDITEAMEDYLEMICRYMADNGYVRVNFLADKLNVRPSSASKMVVKLKELGLIQYEKYGLITLTEKGYAVGRYLLWRHELLHRFFCLLNHTEDELQQVELVEHYMTRETMRNLEGLVERMSRQPSD